MPDQDYTNMTLWTSGWGFTRVLKNLFKELQMDGSSDVPKKVLVKGVAHDSEVCSNQGFKRSMCRHCEHEAILCTYGVKYYNATIVEDACNGDSGGIYFVLMRIIDFAGGCPIFQRPCMQYNFAIF